MSRRGKTAAYGGVVLRECDQKVEVAVIHRPRYDDWSLPKGKPKDNELPVETAVREIREETGIKVTLGAPLGTVRYPVRHQKKIATFWRCTVKKNGSWHANGEVDHVAWLDVDEALRRLSYPGERDILRTAVSMPETTALLVVRHAKALPRKHWKGPDEERELSKRGRRQAAALSTVLAAYGVAELVSSSAVRCMETFVPYSSKHKIPIAAVDALTEEYGNVEPKRVVSTMRKIKARLKVPTAVCGHRPVLPTMFKGLDLPHHKMVVGQVIVAHYTPEQRLLAAESITIP